MPWRVHNVKFVVAVDDARALGQNSDTSLLLQVVAVHGALQVRRDARVLEQAVDEGRLAVIDVSNDRQVPHLRNILRLQDLHSLLHELLLLAACLVCYSLRLSHSKASLWRIAAKEPFCLAQLKYWCPVLSCLALQGLEGANAAKR